jgi:hypothetical protein
MSEAKPEYVQGAEPAKTRLRMIIVPLALGMVIGGLAFWLLAPRPIEGACKLIREGMAEKEVGEILDSFGPRFSTSDPDVDKFPASMTVWEGDDGSVTVHFYKGVVRDVRFHPSEKQPGPEELLSRARFRLGW